MKFFVYLFLFLVLFCVFLNQWMNVYGRKCDYLVDCCDMWFVTDTDRKLSLFVSSWKKFLDRFQYRLPDNLPIRTKSRGFETTFKLFYFNRLLLLWIEILQRIKNDYGKWWMNDWLTIVTEGLLRSWIEIFIRDVLRCMNVVEEWRFGIEHFEEHFFWKELTRIFWQENTWMDGR